MAKIEDLAEKYKKTVELEATIDKQTKSLMDVNKKLQQLKDENEHLKTLLKNSNPILVNVNSYGLDEEIISKSELRKLRHLSEQRELSMEETKKVEIYSKIMANIANKPKAIEVTAKNLKTDELLALIESTPDEEDSESTKQ